MKHLKLFEDFNHKTHSEYQKEKSVCPTCDCNPCECDEMEHDHEEFDDEDDYDFEENGTKYGGRYLPKPPSEIHLKESRKSKSKPDFLDIDKDGNKKESMKKAAKDAKEKKSDKKSERGLSAAQKKLPAGLRAAIARKAAKGKAKD